MFTRDISLTNCILDLIDNSIDGYIRTRNIPLGIGILNPEKDRSKSEKPKAVIKLCLNPNAVTIEDSCGGIPLALARKEVFTFGHSDENYENRTGAGLGVYGIGLKRAIFKIGRNFSVNSQTDTEGFLVTSDLDEWVKQDQNLSDWSFPIEKRPKAKDADSAGTTVKITKLRDEVRSILADEDFLYTLYDEIGKVYGLFLNNSLEIIVNDRTIKPKIASLGASSSVQTALKKLSLDGVNVTIVASLAERDTAGKWATEKAGWYISCNGRLVLAADKSSTSGWGTGQIPTYQPKFRGFIGYVFFESNNPLDLPWTTTKRDLNQESRVFNLVKIEMRVLAKPIITFLNSMYPGELSEEPHERRIADDVKSVDLRSATNKTESSFQVTRVKTNKPQTTSIQYKVNHSDLVIVKKSLNRPDLSNTSVGRMTFDYYMEKEGLK